VIRARRVQGPGRLVVGAAAGAALGAAAAVGSGAPFVVPDPVDHTRWNIVSPGRDDSVVSPDLGRGSAVVGGAMVLTPHVFNRADTLVPRDDRVVVAIHVELAPDSGALRVLLRSEGALHPLFLAPTGWRAGGGAVHPHAGVYDVTIAAGQVIVDGEVAATTTPATVEIGAEADEVRITALRLVDGAGDAWLVEDPAAAWAGRAPIAPGALLGATVGLALAATGASPLGALPFLALPLAVLLLPSRTWLTLLERLYLVRLTAWDLARLALALSFAPIGVHFLSRLELAVPRGRPRPHWRIAWLAAVAVTTALASRGLTAADAALVPVGVAVLVAPLLLARAAALDPLGVLARDLPALIAPAVLGWAPGLLFTLLWRLALLVAGAGVLLRSAPRAAADALFLTALAVLPAAELATRSTWLGTAWDAARLDGAQDWRTPQPFWGGSCGDAPRHTLLFAGGSSTGGAYQFAGHPESFFPAQVHQRLCADGLAVHSTNYGNGGRDSFTISRSIDGLLAQERPAVVVLYLGVNDLLTRGSALSRKQREAAEAARGAALEGLAGLSARSRLLTGVGLWFRPVLDPAAALSPDVPLPDAEENLRRIATATHAAGASLVLLTEYTDTQTAPLVAPYAAMEARLATELPGVRHLDVAEALAPYAGEALLVDRNHLSRHGGERIAELLVPALEAVVGASPPATSPSSAATPAAAPTPPSTGPPTP
jgi:lysophospholipase L1-like esterase